MSLSSFELRLVEWFTRKTATIGTRRVATLSASVATDVGVEREENQDRVAVARGFDEAGKEYTVLALADGIGGMQRGADCAALALASFFASIHLDSQTTAPSAWLSRAAMRANLRVHREMGGRGGSTLVAALVAPDRRVHWLSIGDSRVHTAKRLELTQVSTDDTIAGQLGKPAEAGLDRTHLLQFIGIGPQLEPHVGTVESPLPEALLLTSDGVHFLDPKWLGTLYGNASDVATAARRLVETARWCGGPDNASVAAISFTEPGSVEAGPKGSGALDLWDPFGELTLIGFPLPVPVPHIGRETPNPTPKRLPLAASSNEAEDHDSKVTGKLIQEVVPAGSPAAKKGASRPRKTNNKAASATRTSGKGKGRERGAPSDKKDETPTGDKAGADEDAAPQLVIEFPNKPN